MQTPSTAAGSSSRRDDVLAFAPRSDPFALPAGKFETLLGREPAASDQGANGLLGTLFTYLGCRLMERCRQVPHPRLTSCTHDRHNTWRV